MSASTDQIITQARQGVREASAQEVHARLKQEKGLVVVDVREREEFIEGHLPDAINIPRGFLELRIENVANDRDTPMVVYCGGGVRSALVAKTLRLMGYTNVISMSDGYTGWSEAGLPAVKERTFTSEQMQRYSRHFMVPEVGEQGQAKLLEAKVLLVGAGGLGCPTALYLAAAGVGTLGIVDADFVDLSNLQRQVLHGTSDVGRPKTQSAMETLSELNPGCRIVPYQTRLSSENVMEVIRDYDIVVNGCDNFPTRYLLNDACVFLKKPIVDGSIFRFEGQATVYKPGEGPCYRCLYPEPPPPGMVPSCADAGVLGVLPGMVGVIQATEVIKLLIGQGQPLVGRLLIYDALEMSFRTLKVRRNVDCPVCGEHPTIKELIDYEQFCGLPPRRTATAA
ncbi:MAG: molybdopterin-synthase adenylyltransferase MoeB [Candidatus Latescibacteria bacterium]|nr:molybdopterin-synthase adenylyltransferase MoeB [Candidatus Latescibacterota bacterium]